MSSRMRLVRSDSTKKRPTLDRETQDQVFADLDALGNKYGPLALTGMRRYLELYKERARRKAEIARLQQELDDLKKKG